MRTIGNWFLMDTVDGRRAVRTCGPDGLRLFLLMGTDGLAVQEVRCPDAVFDALRHGDTLTDQQLLQVEFIGVHGLPKQVLQELLL